MIKEAKTQTHVKHDGPGHFKVKTEVHVKDGHGGKDGKDHKPDLSDLIEQYEKKVKKIKADLPDVKKHLPDHKPDLPPLDDHPKIACVMVPEDHKDWDGCLPDIIC